MTVLGSGNVVPLGFTKLVVDDLDRVAAFYRAACGLVEEGRGDDEIAGRPIQELYFASDPPGTGTFTLTKFLDEPVSRGTGVILGFVTDDLLAFVARAEDAGATVIQTPQTRPEYGVKVAFLEDVEGNLIEAVEVL